VSTRGSEAGWLKDLRRSYRGRDLSRFGIADSDIFLTNLLTVGVQRRQAARAGFYVEAIDLAAHECEFLLMLWLAQVAGQPVGFRRMLGTWISEAQRQRFDPELIVRLRAFARNRGRAVHRLLRGEIRYGELKTEVLEADPKLVMHLARAVVNDLQASASRTRH
jgi:hypothetical protein